MFDLDRTPLAVPHRPKDDPWLKINGNGRAENR
jgi:hypothetical protein